MQKSHRSSDSLLAFRAIRLSRLFSAWPEELAREVSARARIIRAAAGDKFVRQGQVLEGLYVIVSGCVEIGSDRSDGRRYVRRYAEPGYIFGFPSIFDGKGTSFFYVAHQATQLVLVQKSVFLSILERHPQLWRSVVREVVGNQRLVLSAIEEWMFEGLRVRLTRLLVSLATAFGTRETAGTAIQIRLTKDDLGDLLGVTRQSVSKELRRLEREGLVISAYGRLTLIDQAALGRIANSPAQD